MVEGYALTATMFETETGIMNIIGDLDFLEWAYHKVSDTGNYLIFFINGYTFSLICSKSEHCFFVILTAEIVRA